MDEHDVRGSRLCAQRFDSRKEARQILAWLQGSHSEYEVTVERVTPANLRRALAPEGGRGEGRMHPRWDDSDPLRGDPQLFDDIRFGRLGQRNDGVGCSSGSWEHN